MKCHCGEEMKKELYIDSIYVYQQLDCSCGNQINAKDYNNDGDVELQRELYGREGVVANVFSKSRECKVLG